MMVDNTTWGKLAWLRASGSPGRRAMLRCVAEYLSGRLPMLYSVMAPLVAFPILGLIIEASPIAPNLARDYGPLGVLCAWLMAQAMYDRKQRDRADRERAKHDRETIEVLQALVQQIAARPCLTDIAIAPEPRKSKHGD